MKEFRIGSEKFHTIPYMNNELKISRKGVVYDCINERILEPIKTKRGYIIEYCGEKYELGRLVATTFIGPHNGPLRYRDRDIYNCKSKNVTYSYIIEYIDDEYKEILINGELFKSVPNSRLGTYINSKGTVFDIYYGFRIPYIKEGHYFINFYEDEELSGELITRPVSRLMYEIEYGPIDEDLVVDHLDGNPWHNEVSNFEPVTIGENIRRSYYSSSYGKPGWSTEDIHTLCKMLEDGEDLYTIADRFHIDKDDRCHLTALICRILYRGDHKEISSKYNVHNYKSTRHKPESRSEPYEEVKRAYDLYMSGYSYKQIERETGIDHRKVSNIINGKIYKDWMSKIREEYNSKS